LARDAPPVCSPTWNDLSQSLLAGQGLLLELRNMENIYLKDGKCGLEIVKTVRLDKLIREAGTGTTLEKMVEAVLGGQPCLRRGASRWPWPRPASW
jgi:hypothetical protein